jgi:hypothetical protein
MNGKKTGGRKSMKAIVGMTNEDRSLYKQREAVTGTSVMTRMRAHYIGDLDELTEEETTIKERWNAAYKMSIAGKLNLQIVRFLKETYNISEATANRDIKNAVQLHGEVGRADFEGGKHVIHQQLLSDRAKALEQGDIKTASGILRTIIELMGYAKEATEMPDFEKLVPHSFEINVKSATLDRLAALLEQGGGVISVGDVADSIYAAAENVEHEEV